MRKQFVIYITNIIVRFLLFYSLQELGLILYKFILYTKCEHIGCYGVI